MSSTTEMPRYHVHTQVWALQVESVGGTTFQPVDKRYAPVNHTFWPAPISAGDWYVVTHDNRRMFISDANFNIAGFTLEQ